MEARITSFIIDQLDIYHVQIFAYSTKGIPGLEINGTGRSVSNIRDKIIYLTRVNSVSIPMNRYVICVEIDTNKKLSSQSLRQLELPIFLVYLFLAKNLSLVKIDDCLCYGTISADGVISQYNLPESFKSITKTIITTQKLDSIKHIDLSNLLIYFKGLRYELY